MHWFPVLTKGLSIQLLATSIIPLTGLSVGKASIHGNGPHHNCTNNDFRLKEAINTCLVRVLDELFAKELFKDNSNQAKNRNMLPTTPSINQSPILINLTSNDSDETIEYEFKDDKKEDLLVSPLSTTKLTRQSEQEFNAPTNLHENVLQEDSSKVINNGRLRKPSRDRIIEGLEKSVGCFTHLYCATRRKSPYRHSIDCGKGRLEVSPFYIVHVDPKWKDRQKQTSMVGHRTPMFRSSAFSKAGLGVGFGARLTPFGMLQILSPPIEETVFIIRKGKLILDLPKTTAELILEFGDYIVWLPVNEFNYRDEKVAASLLEAAKKGPQGLELAIGKFNQVSGAVIPFENHHIMPKNPSTDCCLMVDL